jgi:hypothetical protein
VTIVTEEREPEATVGLDREGTTGMHEDGDPGEDEGSAEDEPEAQAPPRKRWSLFRRGGDR